MAYALITGASKGIGRAFAHELASRKHDLLLTARSGEMLKKLAEELSSKYGVKADFFPMDLSAPGATAQLRNWVEQNNYDLNILINNAGYAMWGWFQELPLQDQLNMMQLNMSSLVSMTHEFIPLLEKAPQGYILNVASTASYQAVPTMAIYAATKSFVLSFSRGLRFELRKKKSTVSVTCLSPGPTSTSFMERADMGALEATAKKFEMEPEKVARIALKALFKKKSEIIPGFINKVGAGAPNLLPKGMVEGFAANIYLKKLEERDQN